MKSLLTFALLGLLGLPAASQDWAKANLEKSPRHREFVTITHDGRKLTAFVAYPEAPDKRPVVLVIHEIFGLSDWAEELTDEIAAAGYVAIAPDLLSGAGPNGGGTSSFAGQTEVTAAVNKLDPAQIKADLNAAADYALKLPASNGKLYVTGYCWGGGQSFLFATERPDLAAAFVFYGTPPPAAAMANIHAPVYGFYAQNDARVTATVEGAKAAMQAAGKTYEPVIYEGAGHGFMRSGEDPAGTPANKKARDDAWARFVSLLSH